MTGFIDHNLNEAAKITIHSLAKELIKCNNKAVILCKARKNYGDYEIIDGVEVYRIPALLFPFAIFIVQKRIKLKFDIVHSFSSAPLVSLRNIFIKLFSKAKIIHTIKSRSKYFLGSFKFSFLLNYLADAVTVHSNHVREELEANGCKAVRLIPSHINTEKFKPLNRGELRKRYNLQKKMILYYGPFAPRKGTDRLIKIIPDVLAKNLEIIFVFIIKKNKYFKNSVKELNKLSLMKNIKVITEKVDLPEWVNVADAAVFPYPDLDATESTPSCVLECLACNTPVITSNLEEIKRDIKSKNLHLFSSDNELIGLILESAGWRRETDFNSSKHSLNTVVNRYLELYSN